MFVEKNASITRGRGEERSCLYFPTRSTGDSCRIGIMSIEIIVKEQENKAFQKCGMYFSRPPEQALLHFVAARGMASNLTESERGTQGRSKHGLAKESFESRMMIRCYQIPTHT